MAPDAGSTDQERIAELLAEAKGLNGKEMLIRDRIIEFIRVPAKDLAPNPRNWRTHPEHQKNALRGVLAEIGYADALIARRLPDGTLQLLDGHLRAETTPDMEVPVLITNLTDNEAEYLLATLDPIGALASTDAEKLEALLREVKATNPGVASLLDALAKTAGLGDLPSNAIGVDYDETVEKEVEYNTCPNCGHHWPK